jgi:sugar O-acyltransferase (sialic acid O-acetyltransferase NeuD family)
MAVPNPTKSSLIIYGAGGHAAVVADAAIASGRNVEFFIDDAPRSGTLLGLPVHSSNTFPLHELSGRDFIVGIGNNSARERVFHELKRAGLSMATIVHPSTYISRFAIIGEGVFLAGGVIVNPNARIHDNCIINTSASVDHDCVVGPHAHLCPGVHLAGNVTVGAGSMIGTGSSVIPGVKIGQCCTLGAGSVVVRDIADNAIADGVPARIRAS